MRTRTSSCSDSSPGSACAQGRPSLCGIEDFHERDGSLNVPGWGGVRRRVLVDDPDVLMRLVNWPLATGRMSGPLFIASGQTTPLRYQSAAKRCSRRQRGLLVR